MKKLIKKDAVNFILFVIFLSLGTYFIVIEIWLWPVKVVIFVILVLVLKSMIFSKK